MSASAAIIASPRRPVVAAPQLPPLRPSVDAAVPLSDAVRARAGLAVPQLFVLWDGQRRPRCFGRVTHPYEPAKATKRQHKARCYARRWWVVMCATAIEGRLAIEAQLEIERKSALRPGFAGYVQRSLDEPRIRQILDCGKNASLGRGVRPR